MSPARILSLRLASLVVVLLVACGEATVAGVATPAIVPVVSTPFPAYAAATPPARLHDRPGGTPGAVLPRGTDLTVEVAAIGPDGQLWYQVATGDGARGWLAAAGLSLVDDPPVVTPTRVPTTVASTARPVPSTPTPAPRPLVVAGSGQGLFLRAQPGQGEIIRAYPDGTVVTPLGEERRLDGRRWLRVRVEDNREGWMAADYLRPAP
jgi:hypothetical protein